MPANHAPGGHPSTNGESAAVRPKARSGPRTLRGKMTVARNAITHGITSEIPVIPGVESEKEWLALYDGFVDSFAPEGRYEEVLVWRLAHLHWRLRRVARYENAVCAYQVERAVDDRLAADVYLYGLEAVEEQAEGKRDDLPEPGEAEIERMRAMRVIPWKDQLERVMRYESFLHRQALQVRHDLEAAQARRRGERTHLTRLDINTPP